MKKYLTWLGLVVFIALPYFPGPVVADAVSVGGGGSSLSVGGGTLTGPLRLPDGTVAIPALSVATNPDTGIYFAGGGPVPIWTINGVASVMYLGTQVQHISTNQLSWCNGGSLGCAPDTTVKRFAAGVVGTGSTTTLTHGLIGGGAAVASAAALPVPTGGVFHVTGTTSITSITSTNLGSGVCAVMIFDDVLTVTDGGNLILAGNFVTTASDTMTVCYDGTNWYETARSVN